MLNHTQKIKEIYEDIQRKIFYMIPEKWDKFYLYASVIDRDDGKQSGELFFYYIPKGILKKNPVNVYEIPTKFNLEENEYLKLVEVLYQRIKELREEFKKQDFEKTWSNITISIHSLKFRAEYRYDDLINTEFSSYERHIIWRYEYLGIGMEQLNKEEKEVLKRYLTGPKQAIRKETYDAGIYIRDIKNMVDFDTENYDSTQNVEYVATKNERMNINQILLSEEQAKRLRQIQEEQNKEK